MWVKLSNDENKKGHDILTIWSLPMYGSSTCKIEGRDKNKDVCCAIFFEALNQLKQPSQIFL